MNFVFGDARTYWPNSLPVHSKQFQHPRINSAFRKDSCDLSGNFHDRGVTSETLFPLLIREQENAHWLRVAPLADELLLNMVSMRNRLSRQPSSAKKLAFNLAMRVSRRRFEFGLEG
jgi:hypothetical protein